MVSMPDLTLKNLPPSLHERLRARAAAHRRSLSQEAIACLEAIALAERTDAASVLTLAREVRRRVRTRVTDDELDALKRAGRA